ncbi:hypothetical protein [uncultured Sutterella sp.]|uniref:hypothetical protein n=1 Tax=uncultured Sutterella sp. TaxID=286133 RepID=UPI0025F773A6|nr:hypothetical protein [uncultured Sutterella sp.]
MRLPVFIVEPKDKEVWRVMCAQGVGSAPDQQTMEGTGATLFEALQAMLGTLGAGNASWAPAAPALEQAATPTDAARCVLATIDPGVKGGAPAFVYPCDRAVLRPGRGVLLACGSPALSVIGRDDRKAAAGMRRVMADWFAEKGLKLPEPTALGLAGPDRLLVEVPAAPALIRAYRRPWGAYERWFRPPRGS